MSWYYAENGKQIGPIGDAEWQALAGSGKITPETLVWKEGMPNWQPFQAIAPATSFSPAPAGSSMGSGMATCSFCHKSFPGDDVIVMNGRMVCATCKPQAVQMLKEGVSMPGTMEYAGFWIRVGAKFVDGIILSIVNFALGMLLGMTSTGGDEKTAAMAAVISSVAGLVFQLIYYVYFTGKMGGTPGKLACGLRVVRADGSPVTYGRAVGRFFAEWVSSLILGIGYIMAAFDDEKRALHDRIADTRVVKK